MKQWIAAIAIVATLGFASSGQAQLMGNGSGGKGGTSSGGPIPASPSGSSQAVTYSDVEYEVVRVLKDPNTKGYRIILKVTEKQEPRRSSAFIHPPATFMDEMGNVYQAADATGIRICGGWKNQRYCLSHHRGDLNQMMSGSAMPVTIAFTPVDGKVIPEIAEHAKTATLNARMVLLPRDGEPENVDIIIPDIALP